MHPPINLEAAPSVGPPAAQWVYGAPDGSDISVAYPTLDALRADAFEWQHAETPEVQWVFQLVPRFCLRFSADGTSPVITPLP